MGYFEVEKIPLKVLKGDGFEVGSGVDVKETNLLFNTDTNNAPTFFFNSGDTGIEVEVSVLVKPEYTYQGKPIATYLNYWGKMSSVVSVVTSALDIPNCKYIMTVKSKKQTSFKHSIWKLRFKQYYENEYSFENAYLSKGHSLPAPCLTLQKYTSVDRNSPSEAILALQILLKEKGCFKLTRENNGWVEDRNPNGVWDNQMVQDIYIFQHEYDLGDAKQGKCDRETIIALIKDSINLGFYDQKKGYVEL